MYTTEWRMNNPNALLTPFPFNECQSQYSQNVALVYINPKWMHRFPGRMIPHKANVLGGRSA